MRCKRCNRQIKTVESKKVGYGPTCLKKVQDNSKIGDYEGE